MMLFQRGDLILLCTSEVYVQVRVVISRADLYQAESCIDRTNFHAPKCCGSNVHPWIKRIPVT